MSSVIDERIVQMEFDNEKFQKGVSETITSLNQLDNNIDKFTKNSSYFSGLENAVNNLTNRFSSSSMIINGILMSLGMRIEQTLNRSVRQLTNLIRSGYGEYETQMGATQTILANVKDEGKGIEEVTAALDELNSYADKTIYNFTEMTRNIGLFTAAGTDLDSSVDAIKGLANAAAIAGVNSEAASRAWYQTSQAMQQGSFRLMDWRSLENAGIAGEQFRKVLEMVAKSEGVQIENLKKRYGGFRNTLQSGWLTAKRFTEAMRIFAGEVDEAELKAKGFSEAEIKELLDIAKTAEAAATQIKTFSQLIDTLKEAVGSGWAQSFRTIFGDFEKAKEWLTGISNRLNAFIGEISDIRNDLLSLIFDSGKGIDKGSESMHNTVDNVLTAFMTAFKAIRTGFMNIFPLDRIKTSAQKALNFVEQLTGEFVVNEKNILDSMYAQGTPQRIIDEYKDSIDAIDLMTRDASNYSMELINTPIKNLMRIGRGIASIIDGIATVIVDVFTTLFSFIPGSEKFIKNISEGNKTLLDILGDIGDFFTKFYYVFIKNGRAIPRFLVLIKNYIIDLFNSNEYLIKLKNSFISLKNDIVSVFKYLKRINISPINILVGAFKLLEGAVKTAFNRIISVFEYFSNFINKNSDSTEFTFLHKARINILKFLILLGALGNGTITFQDIIDGLKIKFEKFKQSLAQSKIVSVARKIFHNLEKVFFDFKKNITTFFSQGNIFEESGLFESLKNIDTKDGILIGVITGVSALLIGLFKFISGLFRNAKTLTDIAKAVGDVLDSVSSALNAFALKLKAEAFDTVVNAVLKLAAALIVLSIIPYDYLVHGLSALVVIALTAYSLIKATGTAMDSAAALTTASAKKIAEAAKKPVHVIAYFAKGINNLLSRTGLALVLEAFSDAILKIAISFIALGIAFRYNPEGMTNAAIALTLIGVALGVLVGILNAKNKNAIVEGAKALTSLQIFAELAGLALIIRSIADSVLLLSSAMIFLSFAMGPNLWQAFAMVVFFIADLTVAISGLIAVSSLAGGGLKGAYTASLALLILSISSSMLILVEVVKKLSQIDMSIGQAIGIFTIMATFLMTIVGIVAVVQSTANPVATTAFLSLSLLIVSLASGIALIALSIKQLEGITLDLKTAILFGVVTVAILTAINTLVGIISFVSLNGDNTLTGKILSFAAVLGAFAIAVLAIAASLKLLDGVTISNNVLIALGIMAAAIFLITGLVGGLALALSTIGAEIAPLAIGVIAALAATITSIGFAVLAIAAAIYLIPIAINNILDTIVRLYNGMIYITQHAEEIKDTLFEFAKAASMLGPAIYALFLAIGVGLGSAISGLLLGLKTMTASIAFGFFTCLIQILDELGNLINEHEGEIVATLDKLVTALLVLAADVLNTVIEKFIPLIAMLLLKVIINQEMKIVRGIVDTFSFLFKIIVNALSSLSKKIRDKVLGGITKIYENIVEFLSTFNIAYLIGNIFDDILEKIEEKFPGLKDKIDEIQTFISDRLDDLKKFNESVIKILTLPFGAITSFLDIYTQEYENSANSIENGVFDLLNNVNNITEYFGDKFGLQLNIMSEQTRTFVEDQNKNMKTLKSESHSDTEEIRKTLKDAGEDIVEDAQETENKVSFIFENGMDGIVDILSDNYDTIKGMNKLELMDFVSSKAEEWGISADMTEEATDLISSYVSDMTDSNILNANNEKNAVINAALEEYSTKTAIADSFSKAAVSTSAEITELQRQYAKLVALQNQHPEKDYSKSIEETYKALQRALNKKMNLQQIAEKSRNAAKEAYSLYETELEKQKDNDGTNDTFGNAMKDLLNEWNNFKLPDIDTTSFNYKSSLDNSGMSRNLKDAEKIASDAGKDIENSRADLTPVVDLDRLSSDLRKANGMAQSTLLAAQNAAIGAYINTDSELNPFLKDRYQSVYNFTQNNYSPKSLSRIDIYRQTQRQLALSRGF